MSDFIKMLEDNAQSLIQKIQLNMQSANINATGQTSQGLDYEAIDEGETITLNIVGNQFTQVIETGRRPTPDLKPGFSMIQNITEWVNARGLDNSLIWAIATQINKEGTQLWQKGGREDIYTLPFEEFIEILSNQVLLFETDDFIKNIIKVWKNERA